MAGQYDFPRAAAFSNPSDFTSWRRGKIVNITLSPVIKNWRRSEQIHVEVINTARHHLRWKVGSIVY